LWQNLEKTNQVLFLVLALSEAKIEAFTRGLFYYFKSSDSFAFKNYGLLWIKLLKCCVLVEVASNFTPLEETGLDSMRFTNA